MKKVSWMKSSLLCLLILQLFLLGDCSLKTEETRQNPRKILGQVPASSPRLQLRNQDKYVVMDNGLLQVTLSKPGGFMTNITYKGSANLLEHRNAEDSRAYWDIVWRPPTARNGSGEGTFEKIGAHDFKVIVEKPEQIELSFTITWNSAIGNKVVPLNMDIRYVMLPGRSGFYSYAIFEHLQGWPGFTLEETRIAFKLSQDLFHYMAVSDQRQRIMPTLADRTNGQPLAYPEAVKLTNPSNPEFKGEGEDMKLRTNFSLNCENLQRERCLENLKLSVGFCLILDLKLIINMEKVSWMERSLICLGLLLQLFLLGDCSLKTNWTRNIPQRINGQVPASSPQLQLRIEEQYVVMDNGLLQVNLSKPGGFITAISYNGTDNLLEHRNSEEGRGYWDLVWRTPTTGNRSKRGTYENIRGQNFKVILEKEEQIELSFTMTWDSSTGDKGVPLNIDKRFVMLPGCSGFYSYAIYEHLEGWPGFTMERTRIAFKLSQDLFHYMAISDQRQRIMPTSEDRENGQPLAYPEAVKLTNPSNPELKGEVDDKYQYSCDSEDRKVHGWISFKPPIGFWVINPSGESGIAGPVKQDLTSHVGPTSLAIFASNHYSGEDLSVKFSNGEQWKKVLGPVYIYLNSASDGEHATKLWDDAKLQMLKEVQNWPYSFPASDDFPSLDKRGNVSGQLFIQDRFLQKQNIPADSAYLGLAAPGNVGSWQKENKGYQFWTTANTDGSFSINGVRPGNYNLYGWIPGFIGDYKYEANITITPGSKLNLGNLTYEPPRQGPLLWEIGVPDRTAAEFFVPSPDPNYINKLYLSNPKGNGTDSAPVDTFRQYGLWERYAELYPEEDLVYTIGTSDYSKDWFFAHVDRRIDNNTYNATTWRIIFKLDIVASNPNGTYILRVALASAANAELQVRFNNLTVDPPHFTTGVIGKDNAIARHGIHGLYWLFNIEIRSDWLILGENIIYLTQTKHTSPFQGIMYDYIRLEGPSTSS
ncbi:uncharacterized protein LOC122067168 [Macadamia integrifolia]|uniref:uncharacterized protein LOC122067168 n=1 Tax=Macadamia integrifolia TaxID=60698 RepID=UPI001C4EF675|nr:uncharacterized protein LOC122067168 [Macadamia integrifolia]